MHTPNKKFTCIPLLALTLSSLSGCAARYGDGIVIAEKKITNNTHEPKHYLKNTQAAGKSGAIGGALFFGGLALCTGLSESVPTPMIIWGTAASAAMGAVAIAAMSVAGSVFVAGSHYLVDQAISSTNTYQYTIKSLKDDSNLTVTQHTAIPLNTKVIIFKQNGAYFIKKR